MIKINDNLYRIHFYNFLNFPDYYIKWFKKYDWWNDDEPNKHLKWDNFKKWEKFTKFLESNKKAIYFDEFPYNPLNIDVSYAFLYKENGYWYLLMINNFNSNTVYRCQEGRTQKYLLRRAKTNGKYDILFLPIIENVTCKAYNNYIQFKELVKNTDCQKIDEYDGPDYLPKLLTKKNHLHFYRFDKIFQNKKQEFILGVNLYPIITDIDIDNYFEFKKIEKFEMILKNGKIVKYESIPFSGCCGHGVIGTFIMKNSYEYFVDKNEYSI